jgi:hypothetical protein
MNNLWKSSRKSSLDLIPGAVSSFNARALLNVLNSDWNIVTNALNTGHEAALIKFRGHIGKLPEKASREECGLSESGLGPDLWMSRRIIIGHYNGERPRHHGEAYRGGR